LIFGSVASEIKSDCYGTVCQTRLFQQKLSIVPRMLCIGTGQYKILNLTGKPEYKVLEADV
jgi:hypothetical protein